LERVTLGNQESTPEAAMLSWLERANPYAHSLLAAASSALAVLPTGREEETTAAVDGLRSALLALQRWMAAVPCPDVKLGDRIEVLVARYRFAVLEIETDSEKADEAHTQVTINRLDNLNTDLAKLLADLQGALRASTA